MKHKKGLVFICLIICLFSIACISAADANNGDIQAMNDTLSDAVASDDGDSHSTNDAIASKEENNPDAMAITDEDELSYNANSFSELQSMIDRANENDEVNLTNDHSLVYGGTTLVISKSLTLNGNGHTLDGANMNRILHIESENEIKVTLKNIKIRSGSAPNENSAYVEKGGGILTTEHVHLTIVNCDFSHNYAHKYGAAIYSTGDSMTIIDSKFYKNTATFGNGGAIYSTGDLFINNTEFSTNQVEHDDRESYHIMNINVYNILRDRYYFDGEGLIKNLDKFEKMIDKILKFFKIPNISKEFPITGGAIYCNGQCVIHDSNFVGNLAGTVNKQIATSGGAIHCRGNIYVYNSTFDGNKANDWGGGAIFAEKECTVYNSAFEDNTANQGCAIYCWGKTNVYNSEFGYNLHEEGTTWFENVDLIGKIASFLEDYGLLDIIDLPGLSIFPSTGGAIWSGKECHIDSCTFDNNQACEHGGAVYSKNNLNITGETVFQNNKVGRDSLSGYDKDGGAIYCVGNLYANGTAFYNNVARIDGGALYCEKKCSIYNCQFNNNAILNPFARTSTGGAIYSQGLLTATDSQFIQNYLKPNNKGDECLGGAIYSKSTVSVTNCEFKNNDGDYYGGAIYASGEAIVKGSSFIGNRADEGGAIYAKTIKQTVSNTSFSSNNARSGSGGAIYIDSSDNNLELSGCSFDQNFADDKGGAVYNKGQIKISKSMLYGNYVNSGDGGAIFTKSLISVDNCTFTSNGAKKGKGGAIYTSNNIKIKNSRLMYNYAKDGGAVYAHAVDWFSPISNSTFGKNQANGGEGGAIFLESSGYFSSCTFEQNTCTKRGGAIFIKAINAFLEVDGSTFNYNSAGDKGGAIFANYVTNVAQTVLTVTNSHFTGNSAKNGGATFSGRVSEITNSEFIGNNAQSGDGGAVYVFNLCDPKITSCRFENNRCAGAGGALYMDTKDWRVTLRVSKSTFNNNTAKTYGGAIYTNCNDFEHSKLSIENSHFKDNVANKGGAVYTGELAKPLSHSSFIGNNATGGDGGALYIYNYGNYEFVSCRFEKNHANNRGGAVYIDSSRAELKVSYCTFVDNHGSGHSIFNCGKYRLIDMCWFGKNNPNFDSNNYFKQQFVERKWNGDVNHKPTNTLSIKISINDTEFYKNSTYRVTIHFTPDLKKDLIHSEGEISGTGIGEAFNVNAYLNDITADVTIVWDKFNPSFSNNTYIFGKLDNEILKLPVIHAKDKQPSEVRIISCEDVKYPDAAKATYEIINMSSDASYVVKNSTGDIVIQGKLNSTDTLLIENLTPGRYMLTIINPESRSHLASSNTTNFTVNRGDITLMVVVMNETYPDDVECVIYASMDGEYNLTVAGCSTVVVVKNHVAHFHRGTLDADTYEAIVSFGGNSLYSPISNRTTFIVSREGTNFEIEVTPEAISYGERATVIHTITPGAGGKIKYYLHNGTYLGESSPGEDFTLPVLNVGTYVIIANYTGDHDHLSAQDSTHLTVNKAKPAFNVETMPVTYGDNGTVTHILPDGATGTIRYYLSNGTFINELPINVNLTLYAWDAGSYIIIANYSGDRNFLNATANVTLTINKEKTEIMAAPVIVMYNSDGGLLIVLNDIQGSPVGGVNLTVDFNGVKNYTTDKEGQIFLSTNNLHVGTYNVAISFNGTSNYLNCSNTTNVTVTKMVDTMASTPLVTIYQVHKYLVINLKNELNRPIANEDVIMTINGVSYKCRTDANGNARLIIRLDAKTYMAKITFVNDNYFSATKYVKVTVIKATPKIIAKKKTFKAKKKIKRYKVKLTVHGKALAKVKVTLKIKGKTYKAITNSKGKAVFKIKKLTKKGKYKAKITYKGNYLYNKVTKKVKIRIK